MPTPSGSPWIRSDEKRDFYVMTRRRWIITVVTIVLVIAATPTILDSALHYDVCDRSRIGSPPSYEVFPSDDLLTVLHKKPAKLNERTTINAPLISAPKDWRVVHMTSRFVATCCASVPLYMRISNSGKRRVQLQWLWERYFPMTRPDAARLILANVGPTFARDSHEVLGRFQNPLPYHQSANRQDTGRSISSSHRAISGRAQQPLHSQAISRVREATTNCARVALGRRHSPRCLSTPSDHVFAQHDR